MSNHTAKKVEAGIYKYRGYLLTADGCLASGNDGAWVCLELKLSSYTLRDMKGEVDHYISREEKS